MIYYKKIKDYYFVYSDKDIWMFWPFEWIYYKWKILGRNFEIKNLKTWKNVAWIFTNKIYIFEEENWNLIFKQYS